MRWPSVKRKRGRPQSAAPRQEEVIQATLGCLVEAALDWPKVPLLRVEALDLGLRAGSSAKSHRGCGDLGARCASWFN